MVLQYVASCVWGASSGSRHTNSTARGRSIMFSTIYGYPIAIRRCMCVGFLASANTSVQFVEFELQKSRGSHETCPSASLAVAKRYSMVSFSMETRRASTSVSSLSNSTPIDTITQTHSSSRHTNSTAIRRNISKLISSSTSYLHTHRSIKALSLSVSEGTPESSQTGIHHRRIVATGRGQLHSQQPRRCVSPPPQSVLQSSATLSFDTSVRCET